MKSLTNLIQSKLAAHDSHVQFSLPLAGVLHNVQSACFGLRINAGKAAFGAMTEAERTALCGPKDVPDPRCSAYRGGQTRIMLGGRRIAIARPRAYGPESGNLMLPTYAWATEDDFLNAATLCAIAAGVSTRRYRTTLDPLPQAEVRCSMSRSAVSRRFVALSTEQLARWLSQPIKIAIPVVMIDGIHFGDRVVLVALGFDALGKKHVLGVPEGSTENARVVRALLSELIDRGLEADAPWLWVIDGAKALRRAILKTFGSVALVQRCQVDKRRNVSGHLPEEFHPSVSRALKGAWNTKAPVLAKRRFDRLTLSLVHHHPGVAFSLREGHQGDAHPDRAGYRGGAVPVVSGDQPDRESEQAHRALRAQRRAQTRQADVCAPGRGALEEVSCGLRAGRIFRDMRRLASALGRHVQVSSHPQSKVGQPAKP